MPRLTEAEVEAVLSGGRLNDPGANGGLCRIATTDADGWPSVVPCGFAYKDRMLYITARENAKWTVNIRRDPRVCVTIDDSDRRNRKVTVKTRAIIKYDTGQDDLWRDLRRPIRGPHWVGPQVLPDGRERWLWEEAYAFMTRDQPRILIAVPLDGAKITTWRHPVEGELLNDVWAPGYFSGDVPQFRVDSLGATLAEQWVIKEPPS